MTIAAIEQIERDVRQAAIISAAVECADAATPDRQLCGFVVAAFFSDGTTMAASSRPNPADHRIGSTMFDAWARQTLEDQLAYVQSVYAAEQVIAGD